jgi:hypothetical protein
MGATDKRRLARLFIWSVGALPDWVFAAFMVALENGREASCGEGGIFYRKPGGGAAACRDRGRALLMEYP